MYILYYCATLYIYYTILNLNYTLYIHIQVQYYINKCKSVIIHLKKTARISKAARNLKNKIGFRTRYKYIHVWHNVIRKRNIILILCDNIANKHRYIRLWHKWVSKHIVRHRQYVHTIQTKQNRTYINNVWYIWRMKYKQIREDRNTLVTRERYHSRLLRESFIIWLGQLRSNRLIGSVERLVDKSRLIDTWLQWRYKVCILILLYYVY